MSDDSSRDLLSQLEAALAERMDAGREEAIAKYQTEGRLTARERVAQLVDEGTFREVGALVEPERSNALNRDVVAPADGVVTGYGRVNGREACLVVQDYTVLGGSIGTNGDHKMCRMIDHAAERGMPLLMLLEGGGHRIHDGMNAAHFAGASPVFDKLGALSGWAPIVVAVMGQGFAAATAYAAMADLVVMIKGQSTMGIAGPALVKAGTGEEISKEELGGSQRQADQQGIADLAVDSEEDCLQAIKDFLTYLPVNASEPAPRVASEDPIDRRDDGLLDLVTANGRKVYDMRKVIKTIADKGSVFELKPSYARNMLTSFARIDGRAVGFFANQPVHKGGVLDARACEKAAHFIAVCDAFGLPLVSLIDIPGISIGPGAEDTGIGRRSGRLFFEMASTTVPRVSVVLRKGYGGGYYAMGGGRGFDVEASYAWPTAEICAMSIEGAVDVAFRKKYEAADDPAAARQKLIDDIRTQTSAIDAARDFGIDAVIDPRETRQRIAETLASCPPRRPNRNPRRFRAISPI
jgi:acetyl-CoA carboxylase carboxyltransferase component